MALEIIQDLSFETDSLEMFSEMLKTCIDITHCDYIHYQENEQQIGFLIEDYPSAATAFLTNWQGHSPHNISPKQGENNPKYYWWVCNLGKLKYNSNPQIKFTDSAEGVQSVLDLLQATDKSSFCEQYQNNPFRGCEGTSVIGYRLTSSPVGIGWREGILEVAFCHIYYSK